MTESPRPVSARRDQQALASRLRGRGATWVAIAEALRARFEVNARTAMRLAHGWSQAEVAERWSERWPEDRKTAKAISYWELWPRSTGHTPSIEVLAKLAALYHCAVSDLVSDVGDFRSLDHPPSRGAQVEGSVWPDRSPAAEVTNVDERPPDEWYIDALRSLVRLDLPQPEVLEERRIVSKVNGLDRITTAITVPRATKTDSAPSMAANLIYGGRMEPSPGPSPTSPSVYQIALGRTLRRGDRHEYAVNLTFSSNYPLRPYYVCRPFVRCDYFELRLRFAASARPTRLLRLAGVMPKAVDDATVTGQPVELDELAEIVVRFERLSLGLAYGLRWEY